MARADADASSADPASAEIGTGGTLAPAGDDGSVAGDATVNDATVGDATGDAAADHDAAARDLADLDAAERDEAAYEAAELERPGISGWALVYEAVLGVLAVVTVATLFFTGPWAALLNWSIYAIFVADFCVRLAMDHDRRTFARRNWPDLIALVPFELFRPFRTIRLLRLVRLLRAFRLLHRVGPTARGLLRQNGLGYVLIFTSTLIIVGGTSVALLEDGIDSWEDGIWWALVTTTTVGYGDLAPVDLPGRLIAVVLMVAGIGTLGMITGSIATYFTKIGDERLPADIRYVRERLAEWRSLSHTERRRVARLLDHIIDDEQDSAPPDRRARPGADPSAVSGADPSAVSGADPSAVSGADPSAT